MADQKQKKNYIQAKNNGYEFVKFKHNFKANYIINEVSVFKNKAHRQTGQKCA